MPIELFVVAFLVVAFLAIAARFMPRDATGARRLPRIVDQSIGMYALRSALGRSTQAAADRDAVRTQAEAQVAEHAIADRIGHPRLPPPTVPTGFVVSRAESQAHKVPPVVPIATRSRPVAGGVPQARKAGLLLLWQRFAGVATVLVVILAAFAAVSLPQSPDEAVLSATGTPGASGTEAASGPAVVTASSSVAPPPSEARAPQSGASAAATPVATARPPAATNRLTPAPIPTPPCTPLPTPRPTRAPTQPPTPAPTPTPEPPPTPTRQPPPTPSEEPSPPPP